MTVAPILVPVDGSSFSEQAIPIACDISLRTGAPVHIVQVHTFSHPIAYPEVVPPYEPDWETALRIHQREHLSKLRHDIEEKCSLPAVAVLLDGPIVDGLIGYVERHEVRQVVMTSHGRGGLSRAWLGSVAGEVVRFVSVPVLLIRPNLSAKVVYELDTIRHILVPLDGSHLSEAILPAAVEMAELSGARITLVQAVAPVYAVSASAGLVSDVMPDIRCFENTRNETARYLERIASHLRNQNVVTDIGVLVHWQAAHAIIDYAHDNGVDLIAMATHGHGAWSRWVVGSVADKVMRGCQVPVLALRPAVATIDELVSGGLDGRHAIHS